MYGMGIVDEVIPSEEARRRLPEMLRHLRANRANAPRFVIGRHRKPEAVLLSVQEYESLAERAERSSGNGNPANLVQARREQILAAAGRHGARNVRLFGSVARGEAGPASDIDLLVQMEPGRTLLDLGGLYSDLREVLGRPVDVVPDDSLKPEIRDRVLAEAVPL